MIQKKKPLLKTTLTLLFIFLIQSPISCETRDLESIIQLIIAIGFLTVALTDKPVEGELRRRVIFESKDHLKFPGGVTVTKPPYLSPQDDIRSLKIYKYDFEKFASSGEFISFSLNFSRYNGEFNDTIYGTYSKFYNVGWKSSGTVNLRMEVKGNVSRDEDENEGMTGLIEQLRVKSLQKDLFDFEIIEVKKKPKSWILRLIFFIVNFFLLCLLCGFLAADDKNQRGNSICYIAMEFLILVMMIKMVILYYFVGVFWFLLLIVLMISIYSLVLIDSEKPQGGTYFWIYFIIGTLITLIHLFYSIDILPFAVLYAYFGLTLDTIYERESKKGAQIFTQILYQAYILFSYYNLANSKYFAVDFTSMIIFLVIAGILHIVNFSLYCYDKTKRNPYSEPSYGIMVNNANASEYSGSKKKNSNSLGVKDKSFNDKSFQGNELVVT